VALMSRKVDYSILILAYLHQRDGGACARQISDHYGLSRSFVANILKELCQHGLVSSHRGIKGGYSLHRPAEQISLCELLEALDGPFHLSECTRVGPADCCFSAVCPVREPIAEVHGRIRELLRGVTLAQLVRQADTAEPTLVEIDLSRCQREILGGGVASTSVS
jgi:Rrf2 family protein